MGKRRKALESSLELMEDQFFHSLEVMESYHQLAQTIDRQLVTGECLGLLNDLGERIQAWAGYSDFIYRHPKEWPVYMDQREEALLMGLVRGDTDGRCSAGL